MDGIRWRSPQVLLAGFALLLALVHAVRSGPPPVAPAPTLTVDAGATEVPREETVLYAVDADGLARPIVRDLPAPADEGVRLQGLVRELRAEMIATDAWPEALPAPAVHAFTSGRVPVAVLDVQEHEARLDVATERAIVASLERTLLEAGVERVAYLRGGRSVPAPFGSLALPGGLD